MTSALSGLVLGGDAAVPPLIRADEGAACGVILMGLPVAPGHAGGMKRGLWIIPIGVSC